MVMKIYKIYIGSRYELYNKFYNNIYDNSFKQ